MGNKYDKPQLRDIVQSTSSVLRKTDRVSETWEAWETHGLEKPNKTWHPTVTGILKGTLEQKRS